MTIDEYSAEIRRLDSSDVWFKYFRELILIARFEISRLLSA